MLLKLITFSAINDILGLPSINRQIDRLENHAIVCSCGRIEQMLARELAGDGVGLVVLDRSADRTAATQAAGHTAIVANATDEETLAQA